MMSSLSWYWKMCYKKDILGLHWFKEYHGFTMVSIYCTKGSDTVLFCNRIKIWSRLGKYNDWVIIYFIEKVTEKEYCESFHKIVLYGFVNKIAQTIQVGSISDIDDDSIHSNGYYMVEFSSSTYKIRENKAIYGQVIEYG